MSIINHIEYLLTCHDCVIVPGIGALIANGMSAYFDNESSRWFPPARVVSFNPDLATTDGLLASSVARRDNITMDAASAIVRRECDALRRRLESERVLSLGDAGQLSLTADGRMVFSPSDVDWLSPATMWLPALSLTNARKDENAVGQRIAAEARRRKRNEMFRRIAGIAACVVILFGLGWIVASNLNSSNMIQPASVVPVNQPAVEKADEEGTFGGEISEAPAKVILAQEPERPVEKVKEKPVAQPAQAAANKAATAAADNNVDAKYLLIVASMTSEADARRFISQYKGMNLGFVNSAGRYRIYAAAGDSWDKVAAAAKSPEISSHFPSSWVCAR